MPKFCKTRIFIIGFYRRISMDTSRKRSTSVGFVSFLSDLSIPERELTRSSPRRPSQIEPDPDVLGYQDPSFRLRDRRDICAQLSAM